MSHTVVTLGKRLCLYVCVGHMHAAVHVRVVVHGVVEHMTIISSPKTTMSWRINFIEAGCMIPIITISYNVVVHYPEQ